jgi:hypothetical protein
MIIKKITNIWQNFLGKETSVEKNQQSVPNSIILEPPPKLRNDNAYIIDLYKDWQSFSGFPDSIKTNKNFIAKLFTRNYPGLSFKHLENLEINDDLVSLFDESILSDFNTCVEIIKKKPQCLKYISKNLSSDPRFIEQCIEPNSRIYSYLSEELKNDPLIIHTIAQNNGKSLEFFPPEYQDNEEIVKLCITNFSKSFAFASDRLKNKREIAFVALYSHPWNYKFLPDIFKEDPEFITSVILKINEKINSSNSSNSSSIRQSFKMGVPFIKSSYTSKHYISSLKYLLDNIPEHLENPAFVKKLIHDNISFELFPEKIHSNKKYIIDFLAKESLHYFNLPEHLRQDLDIFFKFIEESSKQKVNFNENSIACHRILNTDELCTIISRINFQPHPALTYNIIYNVDFNKAFNSMDNYKEKQFLDLYFKEPLFLRELYSLVEHNNLTNTLESINVSEKPLKKSIVKKF